MMQKTLSWTVGMLISATFLLILLGNSGCHKGFENLPGTDSYAQPYIPVMDSLITVDDAATFSNNALVENNPGGVVMTVYFPQRPTISAVPVMAGPSPWLYPNTCYITVGWETLPLLYSAGYPADTVYLNYGPYNTLIATFNDITLTPAGKPSEKHSLSGQLSD